MKRSRVKLQDATPAQLAGVSRSTLWRAKKRGWLVPGYLAHSTSPATAQPVSGFPDFDELERMAWGVAFRVILMAVAKVGDSYGMLEANDLAQIGMIRAWEIRAYAEAASRSWLFKCMALAMRTAINTEAVRRRAFDGNMLYPPTDWVPRRCECVACGCRDRAEITAHHVVPRRHGGVGMIALCKECHADVENFYLLHERPDAFDDYPALMKHYIATFKKWLKRRKMEGI